MDEIDTLRRAADSLRMHAPDGMEQPAPVDLRLARALEAYSETVDAVESASSEMRLQPTPEGETIVELIHRWSATRDRVVRLASRLVEEGNLDNSERRLHLVHSLYRAMIESLALLRSTPEIAEFRDELQDGAWVTSQLADQLAMERRVADQERTERVLDQAERASALKGEETFQPAFDKHARSQLISANVYRALSILAILVAVTVAVLWALPPRFDPSAGADRWVDLVAHLSVVIGVGTLAAYLGRQASNHRQMYNWARSIALQMTAIPLLAESLQPNERSEIINLLARRALSAPPEKNGDSDSEITTDRLLDLITAALKKTS